jgi:RNA polymerase sigma-70 factor (ECF subfamily)
VSVPVQSFLDGLSPSQRPLAAVIDDLPERLRALYEAGRAPWSGISLPADAFLSYLAGRLDESDLAAQLHEIRAEDLYLACACAQSDPTALAAFERAFGDQFDRALARAGRATLAKDEFRQRVREKLFVGPGAKIRAYAGKGALRSWVRVTAVRTMLDEQRRRDDPGRASATDGILDALPTAGADPELDYIRRAHADQIPASLRVAFASLTPRQRNLLRQRFLHGLSADRLATVYGVHRATPFRWLEQAQADLLANMREHLMTELQLSGRGLDSLMADLGSRLDVSVAGLLDGSLETEG